MAEFFKRKEEVIFFEFTEHGKKMFSEGKMAPEYYSFHDSDIMYDPQYAGISTEKQNGIKDRIKETPRLKFILPRTADTNKQTNGNNHRNANLDLGILGNSAFRNEFPRFEIAFLDNEISTFSGSYNDPSGSYVNIPQLRVNYKILADAQGGGMIENNEITLYMREFNATSGEQNFEVEFFEKEENGNFIKKDPAEIGIEVLTDQGIGDYEELMNRTQAKKAADDNRVYWIKELRRRASPRQEREDIYVIDDPGEVCD